jgi:hypothetical protein
MAAPQQPWSVIVVTDQGLKSDLNMHRAHSGSFRVRIEARHEWVEPGDFRKADLRSINGYVGTEPLSRPKKRAAMGARRVHHLRDKMACGSKEFNPPFPFPPGASRGGDGSPHAAHAARQPKPLARIDAATPPARGVSKRSAETPLAPSPRVGLSRCTASRWSAQSEDDRTRKRIKGPPPRRP